MFLDLNWVNHDFPFQCSCNVLSTDFVWQRIQYKLVWISAGTIKLYPKITAETTVVSRSSKSCGLVTLSQFIDPTASLEVFRFDCLRGSNLSVLKIISDQIVIQVYFLRSPFNYVMLRDWNHMDSTNGTMSYFIQSSNYFKWVKLITLIIFIVYTRNRVYGLPISGTTELRNNINSLLNTFTNNNDNNNPNNNSDSDTHGTHSTPNKQNNLNSSFLRNDRILNKNSLLAESRKLERIQKLRRVRRSWSPETDLRMSLSKIREQSFPEISIPDDDFANLYTTETFPEDITSIQPDQWIFFRICTQTVS